MKIYLVGGAVRDKLLGKEPKDLDYVVVGSTPEEMLSLGYKQVGADFPVFLHPETGDEYALARTERKSGKGYNGFICDFSPEVTLEDDLMRRDLTINSMAMDLESGRVIDPFGGQVDLKKKRLQHTERNFSEDPVRVLRLCRFYAELGEDWYISRSTIRLCMHMMINGELMNLTAERVWKETFKALQFHKPSLFLNSMITYEIFPEYSALYCLEQRLDYHPENYVSDHVDLVVDYAAQHYNDPEITWAAFCHDLGKAASWKFSQSYYGHAEQGVPIVERLCDRLKVPKSFRELAVITTQYHTKIHGALEMKPSSIMKLFEMTSAIKKPERFIKFLKACKSDAKGRGYPKCDEAYPQFDYMVNALRVVQSVDVKEIARQSAAQERYGVLIGADIRLARLNALKGFKKEYV